MIKLEIGRASRFYQSRNYRSRGDQFVPFDYNGLVDHCVEVGGRVRISAGYGALQSNRQQRTSREVLKGLILIIRFLRIMERNIYFRFRGIAVVVN